MENLIISCLHSHGRPFVLPLLWPDMEHFPIRHHRFPPRQICPIQIFPTINARHATGHVQRPTRPYRSTTKVTAGLKSITAVRPMNRSPAGYGHPSCFCSDNALVVIWSKSVGQREDALLSRVRRCPLIKSVMRAEKGKYFLFDKQVDSFGERCSRRKWRSDPFSNVVSTHQIGVAWNALRWQTKKILAIGYRIAVRQIRS